MDSIIRLVVVRDTDPLARLKSASCLSSVLLNRSVGRGTVLGEINRWLHHHRHGPRGCLNRFDFGLEASVVQFGQPRQQKKGRTHEHISDERIDVVRINAFRLWLGRFALRNHKNVSEVPIYFFRYPFPQFVHVGWV